MPAVSNARRHDRLRPDGIRNVSRVAAAGSRAAADKPTWRPADEHPCRLGDLSTRRQSASAVSGSRRGTRTTAANDPDATMPHGLGPCGIVADRCQFDGALTWSANDESTYCFCGVGSE
jgi:hypothetical protein